MSGGDFDGDKAWVCWEDEIVKHVDFAPAPDTHGDQFKLPESPFKSQLVEWNQPGWSKAVLDFTWHHQEDNICLGKLWYVHFRFPHNSVHISLENKIYVHLMLHVFCFLVYFTAKYSKY